jgi:tetratricopeptide (TPR) repeat protein
LLKDRLTFAQESDNQREEMKSFETYANLYKQLGDYLTARNFYQRAITLAQILKDEKEELLLVDKLVKVLKR